MGRIPDPRWIDQDGARYLGGGSGAYPISDKSGGEWHMVANLVLPDVESLTGWTQHPVWTCDKLPRPHTSDPMRYGMPPQ
jgi:hypothetical protein